MTIIDSIGSGSAPPAWSDEDAIERRSRSPAPSEREPERRRGSSRHRITVRGRARRRPPRISSSARSPSPGSRSTARDGVGQHVVWKPSRTASSAVALTQ